MVIRNSLFNLGAQIIIKLVSFGFLVFVVRQLGSAEFGKYATATAYVAVLMVLCDLGLGSYVSREVARDENQIEKLLGNMMALRFFLALGLITFATVSAWVLGYTPEIVFAIFLSSSSQLLFAVQSTLDAVLIGTQRLGASAFANLVNQFVLVGSGVVLLLAGTGFLGLSFASLLGIAAATILNSTTVRRRIGQHRLIFTPGNWPHLLKKSLPFGINMLALSVAYRLDSLMLGWFWGNTVVGLYSAAYNLIFTLATISNSVNLALFPNMSRQYAHDPEAARRNFGRYLRLLLILSLPMAAIGSVLAFDLVKLLFSNVYAQSGLALMILVWALPLMFLNELLGYIGATLGLEVPVARLRVINAISNLSLNAAAIPFFGLVAASLTTVLTEAVGIMQFVWLYRSKGVFPASPGWLLRPGLAAAGAAGTAFLLKGWPTLLAGTIALLVYGLGLRLTGALEPAELNQLIGAFRHKAGLNRPLQETSREAIENQELKV